MRPFQGDFLGALVFVLWLIAPATQAFYAVYNERIETEGFGTELDATLQLICSSIILTSEKQIDGLIAAASSNVTSSHLPRMPYT